MVLCPGGSVTRGDAANLTHLFMRAEVGSLDMQWSVALGRGPSMCLIPDSVPYAIPVVRASSGRYRCQMRAGPWQQGLHVVMPSTLPRLSLGTILCSFWTPTG